MFQCIRDRYGYEYPTFSKDSHRHKYLVFAWKWGICMGLGFASSLYCYVYLFMAPMTFLNVMMVWCVCLLSYTFLSLVLERCVQEEQEILTEFAQEKV